MPADVSDGICCMQSGVRPYFIIEPVMNDLSRKVQSRISRIKGNLIAVVKLRK